MSEQVDYPLLVLVKGLLESRNGGAVPLIQQGKYFIVDANFEVALLCLDYGMNTKLKTEEMTNIASPLG